MLRRIAIPMTLSLFFTFCFYGIVYLKFEKIREAVEVEASGPRVQFSVPEQENAPLLLLEVKNSSDKTIELTLICDEKQQTVNLKRHASTLLYVERPRNVTISGGSAEWELKRAELRNLYGSLKGPLNYVILPRSSAAAETPAWWACCLFFLIILILTVNLAVRSRFYRVFHWFVIAFFGLLVSVPFFQPYRILLAQKTFFLLLTIFYLPAFARLYRFVCARLHGRFGEKGIAAFHTGLMTTGVFLFFLFQMVDSLAQYKGNYSGFLQISQKYSYSNPLLQDHPDVLKTLLISDKGYDGQFFYVMSFDPFLRVFSEKPRVYRKVVDNPPYRYGRIGFSLFTKIFSLNQPMIFPEVMIFLLLISHAIGSFFLARLAMFYQRSPLWGALYVIVPAFTISLRLALPESIAAALLLAALYFYLREKLAVSWIFFALAVLVRETTALVPVLLFAREIYLRKVKTATIIASSIVPYGIWRLFVGWRLYPTFHANGFLYSGPDLRIPFTGLFELYSALSRGEYLAEVRDAANLFPIFSIALLAISLILCFRKKAVLHFALLGYSLLAVSLDFKAVYVSLINAERVTVEMFLMATVVFLSLKDKAWRYVFVGVFVCLIFYDLNLLTYWTTFRNGLLWGTLLN